MPLIELSDDEIFTLQAAVEHLRSCAPDPEDSAGRERRADAAFRIAYNLEQIAKRANTLPKAPTINWQPAKTAPRDTSDFAVLTVLRDLEGWNYDRKQNNFRVRRVPGFAETIRTTASMAGWARWSEVLAVVKATLPE